MNTDTDHINAFEALLDRTAIVNGKEFKVTSDMFISGQWKDDESFMLCLRELGINNFEKVFFANSLRQMADKLIEYNQGKI